MGILIRGKQLHESVLEKIKTEGKGRVLDAGCGWGDIAKALYKEGFDVYACDIVEDRIQPCPDGIHFDLLDLSGKLPYPDGYFDYVCSTEVIEHIKDPFALVAELRRVLKDKGLLFMSTPNILSIQSRFRYLFEGAYLWYKYPVIEWMEDGTQDLHINPIRYHEFEYYFHKNNMQIEDLFTSKINYKWRLFFWPIELLSRIQMKIKDFRSSRPGEISTKRLYKIMNTKDFLYGEQMIAKARKISGVPSKFHI